jgi:hypothetical protein
MLLRLFKGIGPGVIFLIALTLGALWVSTFLNPQMPVPAVYETNPMPLYGIIKQITGNNLLGGVIFSFLSVTILIILLVGFNTSVFFINERTFLPALFYILFSALFPQQQIMNPVIPASVFLMIALMRIMKAYRKQGTAFNFFDAGLLISIGSLFYINILWFGLLLIIGIALLRTGNIKEIAISILGLLTPFILTIGLYYVSGKDIGAFLADINYNLFGKTSGYSFSKLTIIVLILTGIILLISTAFLLMRMSSKKIKSRKTFYMLLWALFISLVLYLLLPSVSVEMIWITGIPASYILAHYFVFVRKKIIPEIMFSGMFVLIILLQAFNIF